MKTIYMSWTLALIHETHPEIAQQILEKGEVKEIDNFKYVLIKEEV